MEKQEYQPDFAAETTRTNLLIETKAKSEMNSPDVLSKRDAAIEWCRHASDYAKTCNSKPWRYLLVPHDVLGANVTLDFLAKEFGVSVE